MDSNSSCGGGLSEDSSTTKRNQGRKFVKRIKPVVDSRRGSSSINVQKCGVPSPSPSEIFVQNYSNFKQSGVPVRFMYYMNDTWIGFSREVFETLKKGFMEGNLMLEVSIQGSKFLFDFLRMWQIDLVSGKRRFISWVDDNKKSFFPKILPKDDDDDQVCRGVDLPKVVIEVKIDQNSIKRKREDESDSEDSDSESDSDDSDSDSDGEESSGESSSVVQSTIPKKPRIQTSVVFDKSNCRNVEILKEDDKSYNDVKNIFVSGLKKIDQDVTITSICRCLHKGPLESVRMQLFLKQMELTKASRGLSNLKLAWHGTTSEGVANILSHGFGLPSQISGSQPYGVGVYLSPGQSPETSVLVSEADHNGEKHALFCRVVMGNVEQVEEGSDQFHPSSERFDTGVDDLSNPKWYIVWSTHMNRHILPEYVVSYKTSEHTQEGLSRGTTSVPKRTPTSVLKRTPTSIPTRTTASVPKRTPTSIPTSTTASNANRTLAFVELFDALKSSLSSSTFRELEQVFSIYKERKISKEEMIRRLRLIAGDAIIISTIRKIRWMGFKSKSI